MKNILLKNKLEIIGAIVGAVLGFAYWYKVGCATGTCVITSSPFNSTIYGSVMGGLFFSILKTNKKLKE
ncbi:MAG: hypothetical protein JST82_10730 [Bacteroidetes bacterium]|nr:hypothetical protein [Bacteroidota bacterium]